MSKSRWACFVFQCFMKCVINLVSSIVQCHHRNPRRRHRCLINQNVALKFNSNTSFLFVLWSFCFFLIFVFSLNQWIKNRHAKRLNALPFVLSIRKSVTSHSNRNISFVFSPISCSSVFFALFFFCLYAVIKHLNKQL